MTLRSRSTRPLRKRRAGLLASVLTCAPLLLAGGPGVAAAADSEVVARIGSLGTPARIALEAKQLERLARTRESRDGAAVEEALIRLKEEARSDGNLMYPIIEASRALATEGEMISALQEVFGTYSETPVF